MSTSTARYRFEHRLHDWASTWIMALAGRRCGFFVGLRDDGSVRRVYVAHPDRPLGGEDKQALAEQYDSWFFYLPHDDAGGAYVEWLALPREVAEVWLARSLDATDFIDVRSTGARDGFPESWRFLIR